MLYELQRGTVHFAFFSSVLQMCFNHESKSLIEWLPDCKQRRLLMLNKKDILFADTR